MEDIFKNAENNERESMTIPFRAHESMLARMEIHNKRLWILIVILVCFLVGTNAGWLIYESQFEVTQTSVDQDIDTGEGDATVIGIGDYNGESETDSNNTEKNP